MATRSAIAARQAAALERIERAAAELAHMLRVVLPDLRVTNRDPEMAKAQRLEAEAEFLEAILARLGEIAEAGKANAPKASTVEQASRLPAASPKSRRKT